MMWVVLGNHLGIMCIYGTKQCFSQRVDVLQKAETIPVTNIQYRLTYQQVIKHSRGPSAALINSGPRPLDMTSGLSFLGQTHK